MYSNFTQETCTGIGVTLSLAGATTGMIPFSASYSDGDLVQYVLTDSGGVIKIAGVGTYVTATDDITRNDTWNWNGTVVDNNPDNITLSGGTHTISCDTVAKKIFATRDKMINAATTTQYITDSFAFGAVSPRVGVPNRLWVVPFVSTAFVELEGMGIDITVLSTVGTVSDFGVYRQDQDDNSFVLLRKTNTIDTSPTGITGYNTATFIGGNLEIFPNTVYFFVMGSDCDATADGINHNVLGHPYAQQVYDSKGVAGYATGSAVPDTIPPILYASWQHTGVYPNIFGVMA